VRYGNVLSRLEIHEEALGDELNVIQTKISLELHLRITKENDRQEEYSKLLRSLTESATRSEIRKMPRRATSAP
jgi:hypothetical protein